MSLAETLLQTARENGVQIATAESCTGGMIAAALTDIAGSSDVFDRGFVTYSNAAKRDMIGVQQATLDQFGAVSEQIAIEMAEGALRNSAAQITVSVTGLAGPGGSEHKPEGRVCFAIAQESSATYCETIEFGAIGRGNVRQKTTEHALQMMQTVLLQKRL